MAQIKITWNSTRSASASASFELEIADILDQNIMNLIYKVTNLQGELAEFGAKQVEINLWNTIKEILPANRSHTSLSTGDGIQINNRAYVVAETGFERLEKVGA